MPVMMSLLVSMPRMSLASDTMSVALMSVWTMSAMAVTVFVMVATSLESTFFATAAMTARWFAAR